MRTIIISEIGENHLGDMDIAKKMIYLSKECGANLVKFQLYDPCRTHKGDPEREWFFKVALSRENVSAIIQECAKVGIRPLFTCWDRLRAGWCLEKGLEEIKLASFHIADTQLLDFINRNFRVVYLSTGMSTMADIKRAVAALSNVKRLYLLHCVSDYPARHRDVNLNMMDTLRGFCAYVGYSDHCLDTSAVLAAVAKGACVIEKHFTLSKDLAGSDHILSATPSEFRAMVKQIRQIESMLGSGKKKMTPSERKNQGFLRKRFTGGQNNL